MTGPPKQSALPSLAQEPWLQASETQTALQVLNAAGVTSRVAGGAVRNALYGRPVKDVDIATTAKPDETIALAERAGLKTFATGLQHGTVTVVVDRTPFEVTTLRRDEETDGRHARVAFTDDWREDASRRDFTINALYCDGSGEIFDPLNGYADVVAQRVRFIGNAEDRIREDYLRILRFFRFTADFSNGAPDQAGLDACRSLKSGIAKLSGERRRAELLRLLASPRATAMIEIMDQLGILTESLGLDGDPTHLAHFARIEQALGHAPDEVLRLGILAALKPGSSRVLRTSLKLSSNEDERLSRLSMKDRAATLEASELDAMAYIYRFGAPAFKDAVLAAWTSSDSRAEDLAWRNRLELAQRWKAPELPVRGADILALGVEPGPAVGRILSEFEDWWIANSFPSDPEHLVRELHRIVTKQ